MQEEILRYFSVIDPRSCQLQLFIIKTLVLVLGGTGCCTICPGVAPCRQPTTFKFAATQSDLHLYILIINS